MDSVTSVLYALSTAETRWEVEVEVEVETGLCQHFARILRILEIKEGIRGNLATLSLACTSARRRSDPMISGVHVKLNGVHFVPVQFKVF